MQVAAGYFGNLHSGFAKSQDWPRFGLVIAAAANSWQVASTVESDCHISTRVPGWEELASSRYRMVYCGMA